MKARVIKEECIGCGRCVSICPEVFRMNEDELAEVYNDNIARELEKLTEEAAGECPVFAIEIEN